VQNHITIYGFFDRNYRVAAVSSLSQPTASLLFGKLGFVSKECYILSVSSKLV